MCVNSLEEDQEEDATWSPTIAGNNLVEKSGGGVLPVMEGDPRYKIYELNRSHVRWATVFYLVFVNKFIVRPYVIL